VETNESALSTENAYEGLLTESQLEQVYGYVVGRLVQPAKIVGHYAGGQNMVQGG
jgi:hypothetical protein